MRWRLSSVLGVHQLTPYPRWEGQATRLMGAADLQAFARIAHPDKVTQRFYLQIPGDYVVFNEPIGPRNRTKYYVLLGLKTLALQLRA
ncbi:hypothetical protein EVAR_96774_1 [Eumeta japonica]|uniref:Uncharacterized protein n=1 Tax=Eumeta variegata TaxID=151549 RepID=A0A4C1WUQ0_EUMVA|nr:hypothetical protein EVAR_96774_1 [Eumeta japonica]